MHPSHLRTWLVGALACAVGAGCSCGQNSGAIEAVVSMGSGVTSQCVTVTAKAAGQSPVVSGPIPRMGNASLDVAVYPSATLTGAIQLTAQGYGATSCTGPIVDYAPTVSATFVAGKVVTASLTLAPLACPSPADCTLASCNGAACSDGNACHLGMTCDAAQAACTGGTTTTCNSPPDCHVLPGQCLADGGCGYGLAVSGAGCTDDGNPCTSDLCDAQGTCVHAPLAAGTVCGGGNTCVSNGTCNDAGVCGNGVPRICNAPPDGGCFQNAGTCDAGAGGCIYPARTSGPCDDGNPCTLSDTCNGQGVCQGTPLTCSPLGQCYDAGFCDAGSCEYPVLTGAPCTDGNNCDIGDTCTNSGTCMVGTRVTCNPPQCYLSNGCATDGGCLYSVNVGAACPGGSCQADGSCKPSGTFPYVPSNFMPSAVQVGGIVTIDCALTVDTTTDAGGGPTWCGRPAPPLTVLAQPSGPELVAFGMAGLSVTPAGALSFVGPRPVLLAVYGDAGVDGTIDVGSSGSAPGAGGSWSGCGNEVGGSGQGGGSSAGGGGGGGFGQNGGTGGDGKGNAGSGGAAGMGSGGATDTLVPLRGGCEGGDGGDDGSGGIGPGGSGGGALQISAAGNMEVSGGIWSGGGGGGGGSGASAGGGGGGSGGAILLEAVNLGVLSGASLATNGGGGGAGQGNPGGAGQDGTDGGVAASGGGTAGGTGSGGNGGTSGGGVNGSAGGGGNVGGGGGGGSAGKIRLNGFPTCNVNGGAVVSGHKTGSGGC